MEGFQYDAHPMGIFLSTVGRALDVQPGREEHLRRELAPAADAPAHRQGAQHRGLRVPPQHRAALQLPGQRSELHRQLPEHAVQDDRGEVSRRIRCWRARSTCSSSCTPTTSRTAAPATMRTIGSSQVDPYSALAGAAAALYGPLHGGANEAVLRMLNEIGSVNKVPEFIKRVKSGEGHSRLMGFGHRVYKSYDPRAKVIKRIADLVFDGHRQEPAARDRARARAHRAPGRLLRQPQALSERRLLLRPDLPGDGLSGRDVPGPLRHSANRRLDRAVGGNAARPGAEDRPAAADLHGPRRSATTSRGTKRS